MTIQSTAADSEIQEFTFQEERAELECRMMGSDKVYHIQLTQSEAGWSVTAQYGPRNGTLTRTNPVKQASYEKAKAEFDKTIAAKLKGKEGKHYSYVGAPKATAAVSRVPLTNARGTGQVSRDDDFNAHELLTRVTKEEALKFAGDPRYFFQTKQDGDRLGVRKSDDDFFGYNKNAERVSLDAQLKAAVSRIAEMSQIDKLLMDGEWETDGFHAWDLLICRTDLREFPYEARLETLQVIFSDLPPDLVAILHMTRTARTTEEKLAMLADMKLEGVAIKRRDASFRPGRNGQHKKFKHEQFAAFIVGPKPREDGKRSVAIYIVDPMATPREAAKWQPAGVSQPVRYMGTVGVPEKYELPDIGQVIDVRYLYAYRGGKIAQAKYFGKVRHDVKQSECTTAQFKFKADDGDEE